MKYFWQGLGAIVIFIGVPIGVNLLMNVPSIESGYFKVVQENTWIGFYGSYLGSVIGGILAGLFTFFGVRITIKDNKKQRKKDKRAIMHLSEVYHVSFNLGNINNPSGRLIVTNSYNKALKDNMVDAYFNFVVLENTGPCGALNCKVNITTTYEGTNDTFEIIEFIPYIENKEKIYVPTDNVVDTRKYMITKVELQYETLAGEIIRIVRNYEDENGRVKTSDNYSFQGKNGEFKPLFTVHGTESQWLTF